LLIAITPKTIEMYFIVIYAQIFGITIIFYRGFHCNGEVDRIPLLMVKAHRHSIF
jgi:hypothetical protein